MKWCYILFLFFVYVSPAFSIELHVSPNGNDLNSGSLNHPYRSLVRAQEQVRLINKSMKEDIIVNVHNGTYYLSEPIVFTYLDSGYNDHKVIYKGESDDVVISGGKEVRQWELYDSARNIYRTHVISEPFRQIFVNKIPAIRSRTPNLNSNQNWSFVVREKPFAVLRRSQWAVLENLDDAARSQVEMVMTSQWYHQRIHFGEIVLGKSVVEIAPQSLKGKFSKPRNFYDNTESNHFYFENALEFIDENYEWFYDINTKFLYLSLPKEAKFSEINVVVPVLETLIDIQGSPKSPVHDIEFENIDFQHTNWNLPSYQGINMTQAAQVIDSIPAGSMFKVKHSNNISLKKNKFKNAGGHGVEFFNVDRSDIEGNVFKDIAANCIYIDSGGGNKPKPDKQSFDVSIWNNEASRCGNQYSNGMFIMANNVQKLIVAHNLIYDLPYSAIQVGQQPLKMQDVGSGDNFILKNHIYNINQIHGDGGGVYTLGGIQDGSVIAENYIHDVNQPKGHYKVDSIYLDNLTSKILVRNNVVNGGRAAERNKSAGNELESNVQCNAKVEKAAGVKLGYTPRVLTKEQLLKVKTSSLIEEECK